MYREIQIKKPDRSKDSKELYIRVSSVKGDISVTDLGTTIWVYGDMEQSIFGIVICICQEYGEEVEID